MSILDTGIREDLARRRWITWLLGTALGATIVSFLYPVLRYLVPPVSSEPSQSEVELDIKASAIAPNTARIVPFAGKAVLLLRTSAGELRALTATCTHLACTVQYRPDRTDIWCACHNGVYDLNGGNVSGPPPRPLTKLEVNVRGDRIVVRRA
ncbi:MAG TPA: Rieske 2Fe-2S domain-containing protein [Thermoanaerobaculia bacterium]|nr:Rieske 2Fe-2S domain-containing protein [Thermoanaerobaculia bacterium]